MDGFERIISFDIGIKNMAYCILYLGNKEEQKYIIEDWNLLNLMDKDERITEYCTNSLENKKGKGNTKDKNKQKKIVRIENFLVGPTETKQTESIQSGAIIKNNTNCGRLAKYKKSGNFFCEKCAKLQTDYLIPKKNFQSSSLKKMKVDDLKKLFNEYIILEKQEKQENRENLEKQENKEKPLIKKDYIDIFIC
jgi:hypothetical protein